MGKRKSVLYGLYCHPLDVFSLKRRLLYRLRVLRQMSGLTMAVAVGCDGRGEMSRRIAGGLAPCLLGGAKSVKGLLRITESGQR